MSNPHMKMASTVPFEIAFQYELCIVHGDIRTVFTRSSKFTPHVTKAGTGPSGTAASEHYWYIVLPNAGSSHVKWLLKHFCNVSTVYFYQ